jgi:hypothetical protein
VSEAPAPVSMIARIFLILIETSMSTGPSVAVAFVVMVMFL